MASIVSAGTTSATALNMSADTSGVLQLASNNGTVALTVATSQYIGIGLTTPYAPLHVAGTIKVSTGNAQGILGLGEGAGTTVNVGIWRGAANAPTSDGNYLNLGGYEGIVFAASAAAIGSQTERMRLVSTGQVLVGTNSITSSDQNGTLLYVNSGMVAGGQKFSANTASFYRTSGGNTRNITISCGTTGEYYAKLVLVGLCSYSGAGYFTRTVEFTGYAGESRIAQISNTATGGQTPPTVVMTAPSNGTVNAAVTFPDNYRCVAYLHTIAGTQMYISNVDGTNS